MCHAARMNPTSVLLLSIETLASAAPLRLMARRSLSNAIAAFDGSALDNRFNLIKFAIGQPRKIEMLVSMRDRRHAWRKIRRSLVVRIECKSHPILVFGFVGLRVAFYRRIAFCHHHRVARDL